MNEKRHRRLYSELQKQIVSLLHTFPYDLPFANFFVTYKMVKIVNDPLTTNNLEPNGFRVLSFIGRHRT